MKKLLFLSIMLLVSGKMIANYYPPKIHVAKGDKVVFNAPKRIDIQKGPVKYNLLPTLPVRIHAPKGTVQLYDAMIKQQPYISR